MTPQRKEFIRQLYIRVCRDSGFTLPFDRAAHLAGQVGGFTALDVWMCMPYMEVMVEIAAGTHSSLSLPQYQTTQHALRPS